MFDPASLAGALGPLLKLISDLKPMLNRSKGVKRALLLELQLNLQTVQLYFEGGIRAEDAAHKLEVQALQKAIESEFNFKLLKSGTVKPGSLAGNHRAYHLAGWTTEQLFRHLYLKIRELQIAVGRPRRSPHVRKRVRLLNIYSLLVAIHRHLGG